MEDCRLPKAEAGSDRRPHRVAVQPAILHEPLRLQDVRACLPKRGRNRKGNAPVALLRRHARRLRRHPRLAVPPEGHPDPGRPAEQPAEHFRRFQAGSRQQQFPEAENSDERRVRMSAFRETLDARRQGRGLPAK